MDPISCVEIILFVTLFAWNCVEDFHRKHPPKRLVMLIPYTVQKNDTLWSLARQFNTTVPDLKKWNSDRLNEDRIDTVKEKLNKQLIYFADDDYYLQLEEGEIINVPVWDE